MNKNKVLNKAGVLLIAVFFIFSTVAVTANTTKEITNLMLSTDKNSNIEYKTISEPLIGPTLFEQLPHDPEESWSAATSVNDPPTNYLVFENFWDITGPICDIHWWGVSLHFTGSGWVQCDPSGMTFNITFYADNNGMPGDIVCNYDQVSPSITDTGKLYHSTIQAHLYLFEYDLDPCCQIDAGWVSIQSYPTANECWFLWMSAQTGDGDSLQDSNDGTGPQPTGYDRAIRLTGEGPEPIPAICCEGSIRWEEVSPGGTVNATFQVCNCGDPGSYLKWQFDSAPVWEGAVWEIEPDSGEGLAQGDCVTITVKVTAPDEKNSEFTGKIKMINTENASDFCEVDVVLITPKNKAFNLNPFFQIFLEQHPNLFPILRQLLGI